MIEELNAFLGSINLSIGTFAIIVAALMGLAQVMKTTFMPKKWLPISIIALGIIGTMGFAGVTAGSILAGVVAGLSAMGIFSGAKTTARG